VWFYNQRAGAENLIKEANNDAGLSAHPSGRFDVNRNHFQLAMLAYNLNAWLAHALEPRNPVRRQRAEAYDAGYVAAPVSVHRRQNLASCRSHWCQLQRSLRRENDVSAFDVALEEHCFASIQRLANS